MCIEDRELWAADASYGCVGCGARIEPGDPSARSRGRVYCRECAGVSHLAFVPDARLALARAAHARSKDRALVVEDVGALVSRVGVLVEQRALRAALRVLGEERVPPGVRFVRDPTT